MLLRLDQLEEAGFVAWGPLAIHTVAVQHATRLLPISPDELDAAKAAPQCGSWKSALVLIEKARGKSAPTQLDLEDSQSSRMVREEPAPGCVAIAPCGGGGPEPSASTDRNAFVRSMGALRLCYPALASMMPRAVAEQNEAYWRQLHRWKVSVFEAALALAPQRFARYFPSCGELVELCREMDRAQAPAYDPDRVPVERRVAERRIPQTPAGQEAYITGAGGDKFETLARLWECESARLKLRPDQPTPHDVAIRRAAELNKLASAVFRSMEPTE